MIGKVVCRIKWRLNAVVHMESRCIIRVEPLLLLTLQRNYTENSKQIFPEKELRDLSPNSYIHGSVCDLYIPAIFFFFLLTARRPTKKF